MIDVSDDDLEDLVGEVDSDDDSDVEIPIVGDTGMYKNDRFCLLAFPADFNFFLLG